LRRRGNIPIAGIEQAVQGCRDPACADKGSPDRTLAKWCDDFVIWLPSVEKQLHIDARARQLCKAHIGTFLRGINTGMMGTLFAFVRGIADVPACAKCSVAVFMPTKRQDMAIIKLTYCF